LASLLAAISVGIVVFITTNVDDILLISVFFADRTIRPRAVVIGQFAGMGMLTAASAVAALLAVAIPEGWIGLLGLAPLVLGLRGFYALWYRGTKPDDDPDDLHAEIQGGLARHSQWIAVALVTIANGGDNLGVYIPLFTREFSWIPLYTVVFAVMTGLWCSVGHWLVYHPRLGARIGHSGEVALPFVLTGLGLYILSDTWKLVTESN
jgi:cadmium resistance protein CadD (predicted permease)